MKFCKLLTLLTLVTLLASCATPRVAYLQDMQANQTSEILTPSQIRVRPSDKLSIIVNSKDPLLSNLFNLPYSPKRLGEPASSTKLVVSNLQGVSGYTIDDEGNIDFPVLGSIHVEDLTRSEIASLIKKSLIKRNLIKDPVVIVEFMNLSVSVLGEVAHPGRFSIDKDHITLLDAISLAGDLTIHGQRNNVLVQREIDGMRTIYKVDLTSGESLFKSPAYYLQQNDIVYVEPNSMKARQSTVNGNNLRSTSFWMSLASLLTTIIVLIVK